MARRKGRGPPLTYEQKYKQIKQSGFLEEDIPRPTTPSAKGMVTRYHKYLYGKSGNAGIIRSYRAYKGKYIKEVTKEFPKPKGARRIKPIIQKGRIIRNVTKTYTDVAHGTVVERRYKTRRDAMAKHPAKEIERVLTPVKDKRFQIYIGKSVLPNEYKSIKDAITAYNEARKKYADRKEQIGVMTVSSRTDYEQRMRKRGKPKKNKRNRL